MEFKTPIVEEKSRRQTIETKGGAMENAVMTEQRQASHLVSADTDLVEYSFERGFTDGLPVVPPTADKVAAIVAALGGDPQYVEARIAPRWGELTREVLAVNMVMARGACRSEGAHRFGIQSQRSAGNDPCCRAAFSGQWTNCEVHWDEWWMQCLWLRESGQRHHWARDSARDAKRRRGMARGFGQEHLGSSG